MLGTASTKSFPPWARYGTECPFPTHCPVCNSRVGADKSLTLYSCGSSWGWLSFAHVWTFRVNCPLRSRKPRRHREVV